METEIWKDIPQYKGLYQVSDLGRVKSIRYGRERILKPSNDGKDYLQVVLSVNNIQKTFKIHRLVAITFLNRTNKNLVINHKNFIRNDNRLDNLELITARENNNQKHLKSSSKYVGVSWHKQRNNWRARICVNGKQKHLGNFKNEHDAHLEYQKKLKNI